LVNQESAPGRGQFFWKDSYSTTKSGGAGAADRYQVPGARLIKRFVRIWKLVKAGMRILAYAVGASAELALLGLLTAAPTGVG